MLANILASAIRSARKNARKATTPSRRKITTPRPNSRRGRTREKTKKAVLGELISKDMKPLVDRIKWEYCRQCRYNNWDDCVSYAYEAALHNVIGCEWLEIESDENDSHDGTVSSSSISSNINSSNCSNTYTTAN